MRLAPTCHPNPIPRQVLSPRELLALPLVGDYLRRQQQGIPQARRGVSASEVATEAFVAPVISPAVPQRCAPPLRAPGLEPGRHRSAPGRSRLCAVHGGSPGAPGWCRPRRLKDARADTWWRTDHLPPHHPSQVLLPVQAAHRHTPRAGGRQGGSGVAVPPGAGAAAAAAAAGAAAGQWGAACQACCQRCQGRARTRRPAPATPSPRAQVRGEVEGGLSYLLERRRDDPYRELLPRLLYEATWGGKQAPSFKP